MATRRLSFYMGVNSVRADNLWPLVPRILNKREANTFGQSLRICSSSLMFLIHGCFITTTTTTTTTIFLLFDNHGLIPWLRR